MINYKLPLELGLMLMLSACAAIPMADASRQIRQPPSTSVQTPTSGTSNALACAELQIVQLSIKDTDGTKAQVEANNHVLTALCGLK